jgi:hypothetical protein
MLFREIDSVIEKPVRRNVYYAKASTAGVFVCRRERIPTADSLTRCKRVLQAVWPPYVAVMHTLIWVYLTPPK